MARKSKAVEPRCSITNVSSRHGVAGKCLCGGKNKGDEYFAEAAAALS